VRKWRAENTTKNECQNALKKRENGAQIMCYKKFGIKGAKNAPKNATKIRQYMAPKKFTKNSRE